MPEDLLVYRWTCPICDRTKQSMSQETRTAIRNQAANAFVRHVASSDSNGHGRLGELPPGLDPDDALEHVTIDEGVEDPTADLAP